VQIDKMSKKTSRWVVASFMLAGAGTGLLSYFDLQYAPRFLQFSFFHFPGTIVASLNGGPPVNTTAVSPVPGLFFGTLLAFSHWTFALRDKLRLVFIVLITTASWVLAYNTTVLTYQQIDKYTRVIQSAPAADDANASNAADRKNHDAGAGATSDANASGTVAPLTIPRHFPLVAAISGMVGGFIGGFGTLLGVAIVNSRLRRIEKLLPVLVAATVIGSLVAFVDQPDPYETVGSILLFVCWQAAVAGMIARILFSAESATEQVASPSS